MLLIYKLLAFRATFLSFKMNIPPTLASMPREILAMIMREYYENVEVKTVKQTKEDRTESSDIPEFMSPMLTCKPLHQVSRQVFYETATFYQAGKAPRLMHASLKPNILNGGDAVRRFTRLSGNISFGLMLFEERTINLSGNSVKKIFPRLEHFTLKMTEQTGTNKNLSTISLPFDHRRLTRNSDSNNAGYQSYSESMRTARNPVPGICHSDLPLRSLEKA